MNGLLSRLTGLPSHQSRTISQGQNHWILLVEESLLIDPKDLRTGRPGLQVVDAGSDAEPITVDGVVLPDHKRNRSVGGHGGIDLIAHQTQGRGAVGEDSHLGSEQFDGSRSHFLNCQSWCSGEDPLPQARSGQTDECCKPHQRPR